MKRVASYYSGENQAKRQYKRLTFKGAKGIVGAGWMKPALCTNKWRNKTLIKFNEINK